MEKVCIKGHDTSGKPVSHYVIPKEKAIEIINSLYNPEPHLDDIVRMVWINWTNGVDVTAFLDLETGQFVVRRNSNDFSYLIPLYSLEDQFNPDRLFPDGKKHTDSEALETLIGLANDLEYTDAGQTIYDNIDYAYSHKC